MEVVNDHGFGTGPGPRSYPFRSFPPTVTVNVIPRGNGLGWLRVMMWESADQLTLNGRPEGETDHEALAISMGLLNVTVIGESRGTSTVPFAGSVRTTMGGKQTVSNRHGFGGEADRFVNGFPEASLADTVTVFQTQSWSHSE